MTEPSERDRELFASELPESLHHLAVMVRAGLNNSDGGTAALRAIATARAEGWREAIEECAKLCDNYARDGRLDKEYACEVADELAARCRALIVEPE